MMRLRFPNFLGGLLIGFFNESYYIIGGVCLAWGFIFIIYYGILKNAFEHFISISGRPVYTYIQFYLQAVFVSLFWACLVYYLRTW